MTWKNLFDALIIILTVVAAPGCKNEVLEVIVQPEEVNNPPFAEDGMGGADIVDARFKIPLPGGYHWEVTQSWAQHCERCDDKYRDWSYCNGLSHLGNCCRHSWDFNLPGWSDYGKPVIASGNAIVKEKSYSRGWGHYVLLDHGNGICSRYAHLKEGSNEHLDERDSVCQGLQLGEIGNSGASAGPHLHFQFEDCSTGETLAMGFDDGNGIPVCTRGRDRFNDDGNYDLLEFTNVRRLECNPVEPKFSGASLPLGAWYPAVCGHLPDCPLSNSCNRDFSHQFVDHRQMNVQTREAVKYLWRECAVNGKVDGRFYPNDRISRSEALKIPMQLYGLLQECNVPVDFEDVFPGDWYYPVIACALQRGIVSSTNTLFNPNAEVSWIEAAKFVVESANSAGLIAVQVPFESHFPQIRHDHWGYRYAETLFAYGAPLSTEVEPESKISRGYYARLVAALSPCFCANVGCQDGCECSQVDMACAGGEDSPELSWEDNEVVAEGNEPEAAVGGNSDQVEEETASADIDAELEDSSVYNFDAGIEDSGDNTSEGPGVRRVPRRRDASLDASPDEQEQDAVAEEIDATFDASPSFDYELLEVQDAQVAEQIREEGNFYRLWISGEGTRVYMLDNEHWVVRFTVQDLPEVLEIPRDHLPAVLLMSHNPNPLIVESLEGASFEFWQPYNQGWINVNPELPFDGRTFRLEHRVANMQILIRIP